jgi:hypothetical protein
LAGDRDRRPFRSYHVFKLSESFSWQSPLRFPAAEPDSESRPGLCSVPPSQWPRPTSTGQAARAGPGRERADRSMAVAPRMQGLGRAAGVRPENGVCRPGHRMDCLRVPIGHSEVSRSPAWRPGRPGNQRATRTVSCGPWGEQATRTRAPYPSRQTSGLVLAGISAAVATALVRAAACKFT